MSSIEWIGRSRAAARARCGCGVHQRPAGAMALRRQARRLAARRQPRASRRRPTPPRRPSTAKGSAASSPSLRPTPMAAALPGTEGETRARAVSRRPSSRGSASRPTAPAAATSKPIELVGVTTEAPATWRFTRAGTTVELARSDDFVAEQRRASGNGRGSRRGARVRRLRDRRAGVRLGRLQGRRRARQGARRAQQRSRLGSGFVRRRDRLYYGRWIYKYESAARQGAAGVIIVHTTPSAGYGWQVVQSSWSGPQYELPAGAEPRAAIEAWVTEDAARRLLGDAHDLDALVEQAKSRDFRPVPLGITTSLTLTNTLTRTPTANVFGVLRGSDPALADEYVIYSAHFDHLGTGEPNPADRRTRSTTAHATTRPASACCSRSAKRSRRCRSGRAARSCCCSSPPRSRARSARSISPSIRRCRRGAWPRTSTTTAATSGAKRATSRSSGSASRVSMRSRSRWPRIRGAPCNGDQFPDRGFYYRSDQFNFAKIGVPAFYFDGGTDFVGRPAGWGAEQMRALRSAKTTISRATS